MEFILLVFVLMSLWAGLSYFDDEIAAVKDVILGEIRKNKIRDDDDMK